MAQMEEQINALLSNQKTVEQLISLTQSIGGSGQGVGGIAQSGSEQTLNGTCDINTLLAAILANEGLNPDIRALLEALTGKEEARDETTALLQALRPFVDQRQQERLDQMLEVLRLSHIARLLAQAMGGGGACV